MTPSLVSAQAIICVEDGKHNARRQRAAVRQLGGSPWDEGKNAHSLSTVGNQDRSVSGWKACRRPKCFRTSQIEVERLSPCETRR